MGEVIKKKIVKKVENDFDVSEVDLGMEVRGFINFQRSDKTKKNYRLWVNSFLDWCKGKK
jgi:hypothetical protein